MMIDGVYRAGTYVCYGFAAVCVMFGFRILAIKPKALESEDLKDDQIRAIRRTQITSGIALIALGGLFAFGADAIIRFISNI